MLSVSTKVVLSESCTAVPDVKIKTGKGLKFSSDSIQSNTSSKRKGKRIVRTEYYFFGLTYLFFWFYIRV